MRYFFFDCSLCDVFKRNFLAQMEKTLPAFVIALSLMSVWCAMGIKGQDDS